MTSQGAEAKMTAADLYCAVCGAPAFASVIGEPAQSYCRVHMFSHKAEQKNIISAADLSDFLSECAEYARHDRRLYGENIVKCEQAARFLAVYDDLVKIIREWQIDHINSVWAMQRLVDVLKSTQEPQTP